MPSWKIRRVNLQGKRGFHCWCSYNAESLLSESANEFACGTSIHHIRYHPVEEAPRMFWVSVNLLRMWFTAAVATLSGTCCTLLRKICLWMTQWHFLIDLSDAHSRSSAASVPFLYIDWPTSTSSFLNERLRILAGHSTS